MSEVISFLDKPIDLSINLEELMEDRDYSPRIREKIRGWIERTDGLVLKKKECFRNSQRTVICNPELTYCEGIVFLEKYGIFPLEHAWFEYEGEIIDLTWSSDIRDPEQATTTVVYKYPAEYVRMSVCKSGMWRLLDTEVWVQYHRECADLEVANV